MSFKLVEAAADGQKGDSGVSSKVRVIRIAPNNTQLWNPI